LGVLLTEAGSSEGSRLSLG